jgi:hypothetical protein
MFADKIMVRTRTTANETWFVLETFDALLGREISTGWV